QNLILQFPVENIKVQIESLKSDFSQKFKGFLAEKKEAFIKEGGNEIDFHFTSPVKNKFNDLIFEYKKKRQKFYKDIENNQKENLEKRLQLIDQLKDLIDNAEASTMYKKFKELQDEWRVAGQIPHTKYNDVWRTYHHHVERFYDLLHLNNDLRDLDFKHNLEEKTKLVERAEVLAEDKDVNHAFKELQILHRLWKEDIGPVAREFREDIWNRFSEATKTIHNKRHEYQDKLDAKLHENIDVKLAIIEKIKGIDIDKIVSHKLWQDNIKKLEAYRDEFFKAGRVPKSKNEEIWQLFKDATRNFNKAKNNFYKNIKNEQADNLTKKMHLVDQAESLKDSEDWDIATEVYKKIQAEWRNIGHVPRKDSDRIWKRFKDACNHYFDRLHNKQEGSNKEQTETFNKKKEFLDEFKEAISKEENLTLDMVNESINQWKELGKVPAKMRHIDSKYNKVLDAAYKKLDIDKDELTFLKFQNTVNTYVEQNDVRKIDGEQLFVRRKIDEITKEIKQLENNISFISNASADNPLVKNVYKNIENHNKELETWKRKLNYLKQLEY
ncbi:MAG: DUF349 domain-containing protein, partial [Flavobacteriaceae bacterium]|nr:DUF349 domain-containing protein [Flavobacteriaceae bacterium]